ncbi:MAG: hypothetical protein ACLFUZ_00670 [Candidatus Micrarchaeia archaeon]
MQNGDLLLESMKTSLESFSRDPVSFMLPTIIYPIFMLVTMGASIGIMLLLFLVLTGIGIDAQINLIVLGVLGAVLLFINSIFYAGYKGALINEYHRALHKEKVGIVSFMHYAFGNAISFFVMSLVKMIVIGFFLSPLALLFYFLKVWTIHLALVYLFGAVALFILFMIEFLFAFTYIAYVEKKVRPFSAILISLNFIKDTNIKALLVYVLYSIIVMSTLVPLLNIIMYLVFYPIAMSSLIKFFEKESYSPY